MVRAGIQTFLRMARGVALAFALTAVSIQTSRLTSLVLAPLSEPWQGTRSEAVFKLCSMAPWSSEQEVILQVKIR